MKDKLHLFEVGFWLGMTATIGLWYVTRPARTTRKLVAETIEVMEDVIDAFNDRLTSLRWKLGPTKPGYDE